MSVVTFCLSSFSGRTIQFTLILGFCCSKAGVSFCMMIMSGLLTVAIVIVVACPRPGNWARREPANASKTIGTTTFHCGMLHLLARVWALPFTLLGHRVSNHRRRRCAFRLMILLVVTCWCGLGCPGRWALTDPLVLPLPPVSLRVRRGDTTPG